MKVTIADSCFLPHVFSESLGGENAALHPKYFDWLPADPRTARFVTDAHIKEASGPGQVAWLSESFLLHPENYLKAMEMDFDAVLTHNWYFAQNLADRNWMLVPKCGSWIAPENWGIKKKTRRISMILSEKNSMPGHRMRHRVAESCRSFIDDTFGYAYNRVTKREGLEDYRYSVVIQSERCNYFFNETLIDCFAVGTIPVYWGCPEIGLFFDTQGMVICETEKDFYYTLRDICLGTIVPPPLSVLEENMRRAEYYRCSEDWMWKNYPQLFTQGVVHDR